ncbi:MAG: type II toxin-antitoxin system RelE/ParE family toxin [Cytophagales bacterium]|nr:type II toxin-antitoxin system RelE/ParE family toxin [Cytophagales bacterium]
MAFKVRYSLRARHEEMELLELIVSRFGQEKAKEVYNKIEGVLDQISKMPNMYPSSQKNKGLRKCVFSKQTSIYYRIAKEHIEVVSFRTNRKDPDSFKA